MTWRLVTRPAIACALAALLLLVHAMPQDGRRGRPQGNGGQGVTPCFQTKVPAHPFDLILGRPTGTTVTASVLSYADAEGVLEWGTGNGAYPNHSAPVRLPAGTPVNVVMQPLQPDTAYVYRLRRKAADGAEATSQEYRFHTARPPGAPFTFTVQADSHLDENTQLDEYANTLGNELADQPDFVVDLGDTFMAEKVRALNQPIAPMYLAQRYYLGLLCPSAPLFFVIGNHDGEIGRQDPEARALRLQMLPNPSPDAFYSGNEGAPLGNYYAWTWGDALFIVLDPFTYTTARIRTADDNWNRTLGQVQYRWLQQTLESSRAALKFVFIHHLVGGLDRNGRGGAEAARYFEWGGKSLDGSDAFAQMRPGWGRPVHQLLAAHGVSAVFHGHDHFYAHQELDGIAYQECPQPGWVGGDRVGQAAEYGYKSGAVRASSGHLRIDVDPASATVTYVRSVLPARENEQTRNGQTADAYELRPVP